MNSKEKPIQVFSEIGKLKKVMLHRPGKELENLTPDSLERLLFDDIPFLEEAQAEHDNFARILEENGVEILYLERLAAEAIDAADVKETFVSQWLEESGLPAGAVYDKIYDFLLNMEDTFNMVLKTMEGFKKNEFDAIEDSLAGAVESENYLYIDPMPNLYFTRDPFATIGQGVAINRMYSDTRNRETIYGDYIFKYHPIYGHKNTPIYYDRENDTRIEGGDKLVLSKEVIAVGISQRTAAQSIETLAKTVFEKTNFKKVLAFLIESNRKFMHLDTVFTQVDYDKFTIHPEIEGDLKVYEITPAEEEGEVVISEKIDSLDKILAQALKVDKVSLIRTGGDDIVSAAREQWNDGSNTLAIAPGEVIVYDRNTITNKLLEEAGVKLHKIKGSELVRGRGGPRCMSMPLYREEL